MSRRELTQACWHALVVSAVVGAAVGADASPPRSGGEILPGGLPDAATRIFIPHDETSREVRIASLVRRAAAASGRPLPGNPTAADEISGTRLYPVILVEFANRPHEFDASKYHELLFGAAPGEGPAEPQATLTQFYRDMSMDKFVATGQVFGWYKLSKNDAYYENNRDQNDDGEFRTVDRNDNGRFDTHEREVMNGSGRPFGELLEEAFRLADETVDFRDFDNNGDGRVDAVFLIHSEAGAESDPDADDVRLNVWSHAHTYKHRAYGHETPFVTNDPLLDEDGEVKRDANDQPMFALIDNYIIQPAIDVPKRGDESPKMIPVGVFCHEFGHALGLPDLYDRTPFEQADSVGLGNWCLMAHGNDGGDEKHPDRPVSLSAWCKERLGWANVHRITASQSLAFEPVALANDVYRFDVPGTNGDEYFLIEYRQNRSDRIGERINWDRDLPAEGLAVWHVDSRVGRDNNPRWPLALHDKGQNDAASRPASVLPGFTKPHALVCLVQADGQLHLEHGGSTADEGDLFGHLATWEDDEQFRKGTRAYDGRHAGIKLADINLVDKTLTAVLDATPAGSTSGSTARADENPPAPLESDAGDDERLAAPTARRSAGAAESGSRRPGGTATQPTAPVVRPTSPTVRPTAPTVRPTAPTVRPTTPAARPTAPTVRPTTPATRPTGPTVRPTAPNGRQGRTAPRVTNEQYQALTPSVGPKDRAAARGLQSIDAKLQAGPIEDVNLSSDEIERLKGASDRQLKLGFDQQTLPAARKIAVKARTETVKTDAPADDEIGREVQEIVKSSDGDAAIVRYAPSGKWVERLSGLDFSLEGSGDEASQQLINETLAPVIGADIERSLIRLKGDSPLWYAQTYEVEGKALPIFGHGTTLHVGERGRVTSVTNDVVAPDELKVTGTSGAVDLSRAKQVICKQLGVCEETVTGIHEGIYLIGDDPQKGRVVLRLGINGGDEQRDVEVFFDQESQTIMDIR